jgi:hypothetical protein
MKLYSLFYLPVVPNTFTVSLAIYSVLLWGDSLLESRIDCLYCVVIRFVTLKCPVFLYMADGTCEWSCFWSN